jgi:UDP-glucose 4-epimerase
MPTSLVTGGAGFIGAHLTRALLEQGHAVVVLDDLSGGFERNLPRGLTFVRGSITEDALVGRLFADHHPEYVFHLAAYAAEGLSHFIRRFNYTNNLLGSATLINHAVLHGVKRFVFTSSIAVYGHGANPLTEAQTPSPVDPYGVAKFAVELDLRAAHELFGLEYTVFRPHNVYGEYQHLGDRYRNVVGIFMNQLMRGEPLSVFGDGEQTRAFSYVGDVVPALVECLQLPPTRNQIYNVGGDTPYTIRALARTLLEVAGRRAELHHLPARHEVVHAYADHALVRDTFTPRPATPLHEGLERMWRWAVTLGPQEPSTFGPIEVDRNLPPSWRR